MNYNKYAKLITVVAILMSVLMVFMVLTGFASSKSNNDNTSVESDYQVIKDLCLGSGNLNIEEEKQDISGNLIQRLTDDKYSYYFDPAKKEVIVVVANDKMMEQIVAKAAKLSMEKVPGVDNDIMSFIKTYFPEYNLENTKVELDTESGSPVEFFQYTVFEYQDDIQINKAQISFSYDGQLTFLHGSHNHIDSKKDYSVIGETEAIGKSYSYLLASKDALEKAANVNITNNSEPECVVATEDMVLPDGVRIGDTFKLETLPSYEIYLKNQDDMNILKSEKLVYGNTVAWLIEFTVRTSWGEYDTIFNPLVHIYVDAETGEVLEMNTTDGI